MADDQQNPFTMMGMMGMMQPNPYTQYKGQLPIPGYMGTPTDAQGNPIQSYLDAQAAHDAWQSPAAALAQGTTLNTAPQSAGWVPGQMPTNRQQANQQQAAQAAISGPSAYFAGNRVGSNQYDSQPMVPMNQGLYNAAPQAAQPTASTPAATNPIDMRQAYLTALREPGKVTTPGANVPQAQPLGQPSVLDSFMAAHPGGGGTGAGNYNNTGFFDTLNKLRSA